MVKSVNIKFDKFLHDTDKAILIRINGDELWIPKKLCRKLTTNKKLGGHVCIPSFFAEKIGISIENSTPDVEVIHHTPEIKNTKEINHDSSLFK